MSHRANKLIHDIRNPLNTISMHAELSRLLIESGDTSKALASLGIIIESCHDSSELLSALSDELKHDSSDH